MYANMTLALFQNKICYARWKEQFEQCGTRLLIRSTMLVYESQQYEASTFAYWLPSLGVVLPRLGHNVKARRFDNRHSNGYVIGECHHMRP